MIKHWIIANVPSMICILAGIFLAANSIEGWPLFLGVGFMVSESMSDIKGEEE